MFHVKRFIAVLAVLFVLGLIMVGCENTTFNTSLVGKGQVVGKPVLSNIWIGKDSTRFYFYHLAVDTNANHIPDISVAYKTGTKQTEVGDGSGISWEIVVTSSHDHILALTGGNYPKYYLNGDVIVYRLMSILPDSTSRK